MKTTNKSTVELLDVMGSDLTVVNAARVSFDKESTWDYEDGSLQHKDAKLIAYLARHNHWTPFAHAQLQFRVTAPIFVARQLVKHQVGLVWNEVSRRYVDDEPVFYIPKVLRKRAENVKQGSSNEAADYEHPLWYDGQNIFELALKEYQWMLESGVAPELARMVLPQNVMTSWYWTGSLMAFARICKQRLDPHAQQETRDVAQGIHELTKPRFPVAWEALIG